MIPHDQATSRQRVRRLGPSGAGRGRAGRTVAPSRPVAGAEAEIRFGRLAGIPAARVAIRCPHGASERFIVQGTDERNNRAALELLQTAHFARTRCSCGPGASIN